MLQSLRCRTLNAFIAALTLAGILFLARPSSGEDTPALRKVSIQLRWDHQYQFAGYYAAKWNGYYAAAGFDVEIRSAITPDGKILKAVEEVAAGRADFGVGAADILVSIDGGAPLVIMAAIFQQSASEFYALDDKRMQAPSDLLNLRVARNVNDLIDVELQAMLLAEGIDPRKVTAYKHEPGYGHLIESRVDVMPGYRISAPFNFVKIGIKTKVLRPVNYGVDFYGDSLFTSAGHVERDPAAVERFRAATIKGWRYALMNPAEISDRITKELPRADRLASGTVKEFNDFQVAGVRELTLFPYAEIGHVNPHRWRRMHDFLAKTGLVTRPFESDLVIFDPLKIEQEKRNRAERIVYNFLYAVLAVIMIFWGWIVVLRRSVALKTAELKSLNSRLEQENSQKETLIRELYHRTNNIMQVILGMLTLQARELPPSEDVRRLVTKTEDRILAMAMVHKILYRSRNLSQISAREYIGNVTAQVLERYEAPAERITVKLDIIDAYFVLDTMIPLGLILTELMSNSLAHAFPGGRKGAITITLAAAGEGRSALVYSDDGVGVPAGFDFRNRKTLGLKLVHETGERQMQGRVTMKNHNGVSCTVEFDDNLYETRI